MLRGKANMIFQAVSAAAVIAAALPVQADDLAAARELTVSHCSQCHTFGKGEPHGQGPNLHGLLGREAGTVFGYRFSEGFIKALEGKTWDTALLDRWLGDTMTTAPGTAMVYWQDDPAKRAAMIRYLQTLR